MSENLKENRNEEVKDVDECINNIVVKPIVNIDVHIENLELECSPTLNKPQKND